MNERDIRVQKTNLKLSEVFLTLLEDYWLTKITINQICQRANVHRTTFYKHFKDKYELLYYVSRMALKPYFALALDMRLREPFSSIDKTINQQILKNFTYAKRRCEVLSSSDRKFLRLFSKGTPAL
ncbi:TetR/AcrR family transcriptional regulator [Staphylococcus pseudintermedius]